MAKFRGVRPKGSGIEISFQVDRRRRSIYLDKTPTQANLADAARYRLRLIEEARLGAADTGPAATSSFMECCKNYLKEKRLSLKPSTLDGYRSKLETYWSELANYPIRTITMVDLKKIDRAIEWQSQKTRRDAHGVLRGVFDWALSEGLADDNPAKRLSAGSWQRPEIDAFDDDERLAILGELSGTALAFYGLMFETGARTGELMALHWHDVEKDTIRIAGSTYRGKVGSTKTHQVRTVLLTKAAQATLAAHTSSRFKGQFVFLNQYGDPYYTDRGLTTAFKLACKRAGVRYRRPYNCRHTFASRAIMAGAEPSWVARQMGDRVETVLRHYAKWISGDRDRIELAKLEASSMRNAESVRN